MFSKALLIFPFISVAFAKPIITTPIASTVYSGGQANCTVVWMNDDSPPSSAYGNSSVAIYVGNSIKQTILQQLANVDVSQVTSINFTPDPTIGPNSDQYFIRIQSETGKDNTTQHYPLQAFSAKFTLKDMTGTFNSSVQAEIAGQSTAPLGGANATSSGSSSPTSSPALTGSSSTKPTSTTNTTSASAKPSSGAMGLEAGWAGIVFGAVVGVTMF